MGMVCHSTPWVSWDLQHMGTVCLSLNTMGIFGPTTYGNGLPLNTMGIFGPTTNGNSLSLSTMGIFGPTTYGKGLLLNAMGIFGPTIHGKGTFVHKAQWVHRDPQHRGCKVLGNIGQG